MSSLLLLSGAGTNMLNHGDHDDFSLSPHHTGRGRDSTTLNRQSTMTSTFGSPGMSSLSLFGNSPRNQSVSPRASAVRMRGGFSDEMTAMDAGCQYLLNQDAMNNKATGTGEGPSGGDQNAANSGFGNKQINAEDVFHEANMLANRLAELETAAAQLKHNLTAFDPLGKRGGGADASGKGTKKKGSMLSSGGTVGELDAAGDQKSKSAAFGLKRDVKLPPLQLKNICPPEFVQELNISNAKMSGSGNL